MKVICGWCVQKPGSLRMLQGCQPGIVPHAPQITCVGHHLCDSCWEAYTLMEDDDKDDFRRALIANGSWVKLNAS